MTIKLEDGVEEGRKRTINLSTEPFFNKSSHKPLQLPQGFSSCISFSVGEENLSQKFSADFPLELISQSQRTEGCLAAKEAGRVITGLHCGKPALSAKTRGRGEAAAGNQLRALQSPLSLF